MATDETKLMQELKELFDNLKKSTESENTGDETHQESGDSKAQIMDPMKKHFDMLTKRLRDEAAKLVKGTDLYVKLLSMEASLMYEQAKIKLAEEYVNESRDMLQRILVEIADYAKHKQVNFLYLRTVNHLSYLYSRTGELDKARELLEDVIKDDNVAKSVLVYSTEELFENTPASAEEAFAKLNKLMVNNMQMLAWVYGKLEMHSMHTLMQHKALQKQLDTGDGEPLHWTYRCSRLATLFLTQCQWVHARYHLAAAGVVLDRLGGDPEKDSGLSKAKADLARAWIHYGLHLFSASKKIILDRIYYHEEVISDDEPPSEEPPMPKDYHFTGLPITCPGVPAVPITTTEQARTLFLNTHAWIKAARLHYTLRDHPLQYVNAVLDLSELYRFLAFYEADLDAQYNVQKRRADTLETITTILREVRPTCYVAVSVELLRELTEVQIELMGINLKRLYIAEGKKEGEDGLRRRISAVSDIHTKLESLGDMIGNNVHGSNAYATHEVVETCDPQIRNPEEDDDEEEQDDTEVQLEGAQAGSDSVL